MTTNRYRDAELAKLKEALESLGASGNAIACYLASYRLGRASVGVIAKTARLDRSSAYIACEQLRELGVLERDETGTRKQVAAKPPSAVMARLRTEMRRLRRQHDDIEETLPELLASYAGRGTQPVLQFFSGRDGLRQITGDVLEHADGEILLWTNQRTEKRVFTDADHREFIAERLRRKIAIRVLAADTPEGRALRAGDVRSRRESHVVAGEPFTSETYVYADRVAMLSFDKEVVGFVVRSKEFSDAQRWLFEEIWRNNDPKRKNA
jgi:sugar-specific transcriptional regulator TrmB